MSHPMKGLYSLHETLTTKGGRDHHSHLTGEKTESQETERLLGLPEGQPRSPVVLWGLMGLVGLTAEPSPPCIVAGEWKRGFLSLLIRFGEAGADFSRN